MMVSADSVDVERFRAIVASRLGLNFDDSKLAFLADVLNRRRDAVGQSSAAYLGRLESPSQSPEELRALAAELTVNETYFFSAGKALDDRIVREPLEPLQSKGRAGTIAVGMERPALVCVDARP
jgi:chemotaxis methyl-accepting protein methylase